MTGNGLVVEALVAFYGDAQVLFEVDLAIGPGAALALLGRNGAGKSSTLMAVMGLIQRRARQLNWDGRNIGTLRADAIARAGIGYVPETRRVFADLTVRENLEVGRKAGGSGAAAFGLDAVLDLFPSLTPLLERPAGLTSGGEQQMLAIGRTLMGQPRLLLLDEPAEGLAPVVLQELARAMQALRQQGVGLLLAEQNLAFAKRLTDRAVILERGRVVHAGPMAALMQDAELRHRWLAV